MELSSKETWIFSALARRYGEDAVQQAALNMLERWGRFEMKALKVAAFRAMRDERRDSRQARMIPLSAIRSEPVTMAASPLVALELREAVRMHPYRAAICCDAETSKTLAARWGVSQAAAHRRIWGDNRNS